MKPSGIKALCLIVGMSLASISGGLHAAPETSPSAQSVPSMTKPVPGVAQVGQAEKPAEDTEEVSINSATAEQLAAALNGVGLKKAQAIVSYREQNGPFTQIDQLQEVPGIGRALIERNQARLRL